MDGLPGVFPVGREIEHTAQDRAAIHRDVTVGADGAAPFQKGLAVGQVEQLDQLKVAHAATAQAQQMRRRLGGFSLVEADARAHTDSKSGTGIDRKCHAGLASNSASIFGSSLWFNPSSATRLCRKCERRSANFEVRSVRHSEFAIRHFPGSSITSCVAIARSGVEGLL